MEQTNNYYPKFDEGQVLSSQALNSYFGYLEEQQRLTRTKLLGVGIIDGLEFTYNDNNTITITQGTAVTADGYLIELPKDTTYTLAYEYNKNSDMLAKRNPLKETDDKEFDEMLSHIKYVLYENESDASKHNQNLPKSTIIPKDLSKYIISLMVDFVSQDTITKCNELSCDIVQSNYQIEVRPVLIELTTFIEQNGKTTYSFQTINNIKKFDIAYTLCEIRIRGYKYNTIFSNYLTTLIEKYIIPNFNSAFYDIIPTEKDTTEAILNNNTRNICQFLNLAESSTSFNNILLGYVQKIISFKTTINNTVPCSGHYIKHLINIEKGIEEYIDVFNSFIDKYQTIPTNNTKFNRIVMLGSCSDVSNSLYRHINSILLHNSHFLADRKLLQKTLNHIFSLVDSFNKDYKANYNNTEETLESNLNHCFHLEKKYAKIEEQRKPDFYNKNSLDNDNTLWKLNLSDDKSSYETGDFLHIGNYYNLPRKVFRDMLLTFLNKHRFFIPRIEFIPVGTLPEIIKKYKPEDYNRSEFYKFYRTVLFDDNFHCYEDATPKKGDITLDRLFKKIDTEKDELDYESTRRFLDMIFERIELYEYCSLNGGLMLSAFHKTQSEFHDKTNNPVLYSLIQNYSDKLHAIQKYLPGVATVGGLFRSIAKVTNYYYYYRDYDNPYLRYCVNYLSLFAICHLKYLDGCPLGGKLFVFYTCDDEEKVLLVAGNENDCFSYNLKVDTYYRSHLNSIHILYRIFQDF